MSEAMLAMVLDIEVDRHKREVAEGFATLKAKLPPEPPKPEPDLFALYNKGLTNAQIADISYLNAMCMQAANLEYHNPYSAWPVVNSGICFPGPGRWF